MITIKVGKHIHTSLDMVPITQWLTERIGHDTWKWQVDDEWIPGWGHQMLVEFDDSVDEELISIFRMMHS